MEEVDRWMVTYTKHLKQKRKVYHDGFLDIHRSGNKTKLYDEFEKLLECRLLKEDEVIGSGETLTFNSYLVDIDTPQGDHKQESGLNFQPGDDKISEKPGVLRGKSFRNSSTGFGNASIDKSKTRPTLSPSHQMIREFKKSRLKSYGSPQTSPDTRKTEETEGNSPSERTVFLVTLVLVQGEEDLHIGWSFDFLELKGTQLYRFLEPNEWQVLYTTNITQKAKKYHDGFLKLSVCGSHGRQIMLFDENRKLLNSRFIKKDETVKSGESIAFDGHLVEIGECASDHKPPKMSLNQGSRSGDGGTTVLHGQKKCTNENEISTGKEWHVLYTSQITQKSKKYHNGIIRVTSSGSHHMQITLLNEDKIILGRKHIGLSKNLMMGETLELPKYLVEVGEACESVEELENRNNDKRNVTSFCISGEDEKRSSKETTKKTLRDAHGILSILQRPKTRVSMSSGQADGNISISVSSNKVPEPSPSEASHLPIDDRSHKKPSENLDTREPTSFTGNGKTLAEDFEIGHSSQLRQSDYVETKSSSLKNSITRTEGSSDSAACDLVHDDEKICEETTYEREINGCPSFDLGI